MNALADVRAGHIVGLALLSALCLTSIGCKKEASSEAPYMDQGGEAMQSSDPLGELERLEARMDELGLQVAGRERDGADATAGPGEGAAADGDAATGEDELAEEAPEPTDAAATTTAPPPRDDRQHCEDLCSLSESICELEVRICSLSESHAGDATYADACERAVEDCDVAGEACNTC